MLLPTSAPPKQTYRANRGTVPPLGPRQLPHPGQCLRRRSDAAGNGGLIRRYTPNLFTRILFAIEIVISQLIEGPSRPWQDHYTGRRYARACAQREYNSTVDLPSMPA